MISKKVSKSIEYDKIIQEVSSLAVLQATKDYFTEFIPQTDITVAKKLLDMTEEAYKLIYNYNVGCISYFDNLTEEVSRVKMGGILSIPEILRVASNLKSARMLRTSVEKVNDKSIVYIREIASRLYYNHDFEKEVSEKILSPEELSDNASPRLASIRRSIRSINVRIRDKLNSYMRGTLNKYLQDSVVTVREDRFVIPVKAEYKSMVKGFIHDQSSTGSTLFIEPEAVMELNNDLKRACFDEQEEIHRILSELSSKICNFADALNYNEQNVSEIDCFFARAEYGFNNKCSKPILNDNGYINIKNGRHPLINKEKVVPVSLKLGKGYNFLLITGPNTGGKTVTLKLCGLLCLMAMSGLYIPAEEESDISVFNGVYADIGDEQSIEQDLSTFSSHITNIINILNNIDGKSLVLLDEIGAGTDPDEGSALALSIIKKFLKTNCYGIITTHYSKLKEFAGENPKIENASMEFDVKTLKPVYKLNIGIPGSSNAIDIAKTLGLDNEVISDAYANLSDKSITFESVLKKAEEARREADAIKKELILKQNEIDNTLKTITEEKDKVLKEKEKIYQNARQETKRIVADKLSEAEEIIDELKKILKQAGLESREIFRASELKNRIKNSKYLSIDDEDMPFELKKVDANKLVSGNTVFVKSLKRKAKLVSVKSNKKEAEVLLGDIKTTVKINDLFNQEAEQKRAEKVEIIRNTSREIPKQELNVLGLDSIEALAEVKKFIDSAIVNNLEEIKVIHGYGEGVLVKVIRNYLKTDKNVKEFRRGQYGEGENGVTIITLK